MKRKIISIGIVLVLVFACSRDEINRDGRVEIPDFNFPQTVTFKEKLSDYDIFKNAPELLLPSDEFYVLELSSVLFTDYAYKQRLVKLPQGTEMKKLNDGSIEFPNGSILTKTFYYYLDERDTSLGKRIIETRLLIKESDTWNAATYVWNASQTEATLNTEGSSMPMSWINADGVNLSTEYKVPSSNECMTCHQSKGAMTSLGPTLTNLNKDVERNGASINQLSHLQNLGLLEVLDASQIPHMVNYKNSTAPLAERGRAYLAMNCAHCHNPHAWDTPAERDFDFRLSTSLNASGIPFEKDKIMDALIENRMPFIGTTLKDEEGVDLMIEYLNSL